MGSITLSQTTGWISPRTNPWAAASVSGDTAFQLVLSGVSTSLEAATVRVVSSTSMMTATASAIIAAKRNRKRIIELPHVHHNRYGVAGLTARSTRASLPAIRYLLHRADWGSSGRSAPQERSLQFSRLHGAWHSAADRLDEPRARSFPGWIEDATRRGGRVV